MAIYKIFKKKVHSNLFAELNDDLDSLTYIWLIKDVSSLITQEEAAATAGEGGNSGGEIRSESFTIHGYWFKARARLELNPDGFVYASLTLTSTQKRRFLKFLNFVGQLPVPRARYVLKNRSSSGNNSSKEEVTSDLVRSGNNNTDEAEVTSDLVRSGNDNNNEEEDVTSDLVRSGNNITDEAEVTVDLELGGCSNTDEAQVTSDLVLGGNDNNNNNNEKDEITSELVHNENDEEVTFDLVRSRNNLLGHYLFYNTPTYRMRLGEKEILTNPSYNAEDSLILEVHVEPPSVSSRASCTDGSLTWKVAGYCKCKELAQKQLLLFQQSPYFYTRPKGHRVVVELRLNGHGSYEGKGLTAAICFLTGKFDLALSDTYRQESELVLINQSDPSKSIRKTVKGKLSEEKRYSMDVASHEEMEKDGFLKNDALIFKVRVKTNAFHF